MDEELFEVFFKIFCEGVDMGIKIGEAGLHNELPDSAIKQRLRNKFETLFAKE